MENGEYPFEFPIATISYSGFQAISIRLTGVVNLSSISLN